MHSEGLQINGPGSRCPGHVCVCLLSKTAWQDWQGIWSGSDYGSSQRDHAELQDLSVLKMSLPVEFLCLSWLSHPIDHEILGILANY